MVLKELQKKSYRLKKQLVSLGTQVLDSRKWVQAGKFQGTFKKRATRVIIQGKGTCDHVSCQQSSCFPKQNVVLSLELKVVVVVFCNF